ncbi:ABC transporter permease [uncultured Paludibaculum sp.]|uniref:ABC transporter permease n=1 Tax=uncultured Paludibaculum sp. TaxID=1765020 RepID=UPI002AAB3A24|nr:ABC transporter permease [uncultured Paludibaculum sp.]
MKNLVESARMALAALSANRMRSLLTMLGIIIGVAAVIAMVSVGSGATERISEQIASMGSNLIVIMPGSLTSGGMRMGSGMSLTLTEEDAAAIAAECPSVAQVAPMVRSSAQVIQGNNNWATSVIGTVPSYLEVRDLTLERGEPFTTQDVDSSARVALLGETVVQNLFGGMDPIGQVFRIRNVPFTVSGVLTPKGQSPMGQDQDDVILIPLTTAKQRVLGTSQANAHSIGNVLVEATGPGQMDSAIDQMTQLLRQRHRIQPGSDDDFSVRNLSEVFSAQEESASVMAILLGAIASVSLIVGGIGIMNIMLVSVTERTKEIGIRKAIGARMSDILSQFLVEAVTLSLVGGVAGIVLGLGGSWAISAIAHWSTQVSVSAIALAFVFSALVGVFFGYYPARQAARLDPILALRFE